MTDNLHDLDEMVNPSRCNRPPEGWICTRGYHKDGPCAAVQEGSPSHVFARQVKVYQEYIKYMSADTLMFDQMFKTLKLALAEADRLAERVTMLEQQALRNQNKLMLTDTLAEELGEALESLHGYTGFKFPFDVKDSPSKALNSYLQVEAHEG